MKRARSTRAHNTFAVEFDRERDGRWIAEIPRLPGVMAYGVSRADALRRVSAIALRTLADSVEHGSRIAPVSRLFHGVGQR
jgi:predicted RNase H-like HicB family nuclease